MKKIYLLLILVLMSLCTYSQKNNISISVTPSKPLSIFFYNVDGDMDGGADYEEERLIAVNLEYSRHMAAGLYIGAGLSFSHYKIKSTPPFYPNTTADSHSQIMNFVSIPIDVKYKFGRYFFANSGIDLNFRVSKINKDYFGDNSNILGLHIGVGAEYTFDKKVNIFVNPYFQMNDLGFGDVFNLYALGVKMGVGYNF